MLFTLFSVGAVHTSAQEPSVLTYIEGFPVPETMAEDKDLAYMFDKFDGRIIESLLIGSANLKETMDYYEQTLPQLGWVLSPPDERERKLVFVKEQEQLNLLFRESGAELEVVVLLRPVSP